MASPQLHRGTELILKFYRKSVIFISQMQPYTKGYRNMRKTNDPLSNEQVNKMSFSSKKIYVPISATSENPTHSQQPQKSGQQDSLHALVDRLKKQSQEMKMKEEVYIDKLMKLEEGLEKQHKEYLQLQDIYTELFTSYKRKEEEIAELEMLYRETNRKRDTVATDPLSKSLQTSKANKLEKEVAEKEQKIRELSSRNMESEQSIAELKEQARKLVIENNYHKSKEKMMDSRVSLRSKVFEELEEWQKVVETEKEEKIRVQYENQFLKNRNEDLDKRVKEMEDLIANLRAEFSKLRQTNILLHREKSQSRLEMSKEKKSREKSPIRSLDRKNDNRSPEHGVVGAPLSVERNGIKERDESPKEKAKMKENKEKEELKAEAIKLRKMEDTLFNVRQYPSSHSEQGLNREGPIVKERPGREGPVLKKGRPVVKEQAFFSFSREGTDQFQQNQQSRSEEMQGIESSQSEQPFNKEKNMENQGGLMSQRSYADSLESDKPHIITYQEFSQGEAPELTDTQEHSKSMARDSPARFASLSREIGTDLQELPASLQIEALIRSRKIEQSPSKIDPISSKQSS